MKIIQLLLLFTILLLSCAQEPLTGEIILKKSIQFHDPNNHWTNNRHELTFEEIRPDGQIRDTYAVIDIMEEYFELHRKGNHHYKIQADELIYNPDSLMETRATTLKNYYTYLWGLPMKLLDEETNIAGWKESLIDDTPTYEVQIDYEKDTWFFQFDKKSFEMLGYRFYQDSILSKGEVIILEGLVNVSGMKIPASRSWYTLPDNKYLGKDVLLEK